MTNTTLKTRIKLKNGTPEEWSQAINFSPLKGELVIYNDADNPRMKVGDGETNINDLPFVNNASLENALTIDKNDEETGTIPYINADQLGGLPASDYALKIDPAPDAVLLGGKEPKYYIQPHNLLDNSDFRKPVNQRGQTSYTGAFVYGIDLWQTTNANTTVTVESDGIILTNTTAGSAGYLLQIIDNPQQLLGKTLTLAVSTNDDKIAAGSCVLPSAFPSSNTVYLQIYDGELTIGGILLSSREIWVRIWSNANENSRFFSWAVLYEGSYTADNLPPYTPKGYAAELLACKTADTGGIDADTLGGKAPEYYIQPRNLLDNSDFTNPVNQRGLTTYEAPSGAPYNIDRWYGNRATIVVEDDGITLNRNTTASTSSTYIGQKMEHIERLVGKTLTLAFMTDIGMLVGSFNFTDSNITILTENGWTLAYSTSATAFVIQTSTEESIKLYWAALYEGSYTADNLPPYVPKGYGVELAECRKYYRKYPEHPLIGIAFYANSVAIIGTEKTPMRGIPTITYTTITNIDQINTYVSNSNISTKNGVVWIQVDGDVPTGTYLYIWGLEENSDL